MNTKYLFLDIDGTLVGYDSKMPESALAALNAAQKNGHKVIIASGRSRSIIYPDLLAAVDFDGIIASGGACVVCNGEVIFRSTITGDTFRGIVDYFRREGIRFIVQSSEASYGEPDFRTIMIPAMIKSGYSKDLIDKSFSDVITVDDILSVPDVEKFSYYLSPLSPKQISDDNDGKFYVTDFSVGKAAENSELFFGEMNMAGVNKATAIERYMAHVGAPISDSIAFGDSGNDLEMMKFAGFSVAMGNATQPIKDAADMITDDVDKDGIYNAFVKLGLI
ncbi:MAG: HAD family hydrolase [Ruminococcaceae bacterium]|nr:HAD family hydrolase [Oscillospiraceae bacterium]